MEFEFENILSIQWWFSVVVVGVLINLLSAYVKPALDRKISRYSRSHERKLEIDNKIKSNEFDELKNSIEARYNKKLELIDIRLGGLTDLAYAILLLALSINSKEGSPILASITTLLSIFFMIIFIRQHLDHHKKRRFLLDAEIESEQAKAED